MAKVYTWTGKAETITLPDEPGEFFPVGTVVRWEDGVLTFQVPGGKPVAACVGKPHKVVAMTHPRPAPLRVRTDDLPPPVEVVRELPGPGVLVAAARCVLFTALVGLLAFACVALTGCDNGGSSHSGTSLGERVYDVTEAAWYARGDLPAIGDRGNCERLHMLEVLAPATQATYLGYCKRDGWACLHWAALTGRVRGLYYPVAVMNPRLPADRWPAHALHELLHAAAACAGLDGRSHTDPRIWEGTADDPHPDSVESVGERVLYHPAE